MLKLHIGNISDKEKRMETKKLIDCCEFISDGDHLPPPKSDSGVPFITISNITGQNKLSFEDTMFVPESYYNGLNENKKAKKGDILYSVVGSFGKPVYVDFDKQMVFQRHIAILRPKRNVNARFIYYTMLNPQFYKLVDKLAIGCSQRTVTLDTLRNIEVNLPDKDIQDKMVGILSLIDEKIDINNNVNDNLEQQAKFIYDYWFTQFDFPDENGKPYCSSGGKMVWNEQLKRNIPENWNVVPLLKLVSWESNSQPPKSEFVYEPKEGYVRFIQNRDYDSDTHITYIPRTKNLSIVDRFDILMDKYGDAGAVRYGIEGAFNVALGKICVHNPNYREYIRSFLGSDGIYKFLHNSCMASTRASLSEANLAILNVVVPDEKIILDYENFLHKIRVSILKNKDETVELINLRDWLLPMLMNGQATIAD